jgi:hypothetical protein
MVLQNRLPQVKSVGAMTASMASAVERIETMARLSNCDDEAAQEALIDTVTYFAGNRQIYLLIYFAGT